MPGKNLIAPLEKTSPRPSHNAWYPVYPETRPVIWATARLFLADTSVCSTCKAMRWRLSFLHTLATHPVSFHGSSNNPLVSFKSVGMDPLLLAAHTVPAMAIFLPSSVTPSGPEARGYVTKGIPPRMTFAAPISFFKSISMIFGRAGLIFEGSTNGGGCRNETFCQGLPGVNPQRSNQIVLRRNSFWEMLYQKETGTAFGRKLGAASHEPCLPCRRPCRRP